MNWIGYLAKLSMQPEISLAGFEPLRAHAAPRKILCQNEVVYTQLSSPDHDFK